MGAAVKVVWEPHPGSQTRFLTCPIWEVLYEGSRGPGKTDALLMDFAQFVGAGYGSNWRGILFRREYKHLDDIIAKSKRWFRQIFPGARWLSSKSDYKWVFPGGEELLFRHIKDPDDYWDYHGHEYPWIGWEELTNWPTLDCYEAMKSCSRSSVRGMPRRVRATCNPWGVGHSAVKEYFISPAPAETVITDAKGLKRVRIHGKTSENKALLAAQPEYLTYLDSIKNENLKKAWRDGDWDVVVGGFLQGVWDRAKHVVKPFKIPDDWPRWRALDWGFAKPYSVGWYCIDPDGVIYRYRELYGYGGSADVGTRESAAEVIKKIKEIEAAETKRGIRFKRSPADSSIWDNVGTSISVGSLFDKANIHWIKAAKGPGSRKNGAQVVIDRLKDGTFKVFDTCTHWLRTVPVLMPDANDWEDVDTEQEDHCWDETRYSLTAHHRPKRLLPASNKPKYGTLDHLIEVTQARRKSTYNVS